MGRQQALGPSMAMVRMGTSSIPSEGIPALRLRLWATAGSGHSTCLRPTAHKLAPVRSISQGLLLGLSLGFLPFTVPPAAAGSVRAIEFECPCFAEWVPQESGDAGELKVNFGLRNHRKSETGPVRYRLGKQRSAREAGYVYLGPYSEASQPLAPSSLSSDLQYREAVRFEDLPAAGQFLVFGVQERAAERPVVVRPWGTYSGWENRERVALWREPDIGDAGTIRFVDLLTDSDGDGVGDANEWRAGSSADNPEDKPGDTVIDVLALFSKAALAAYGDYPSARIHHLMTVTKVIFADSGTNIRLRTVGMLEVKTEVSRWGDDTVELAEQAGADLNVRFFVPGFERGCTGAGCVNATGGAWRGAWLERDARSMVSFEASALTVAHELGHNMGLKHSARQGESNGLFRWSRGHYYAGDRGTVMTYGDRSWSPYFSSPSLRCGFAPCGLATHHPNAADAARSLDLIRFQVAGLRAAQADGDGDGFVEGVDAFPDDASDWADWDGDGIGDNADSDDDNDGVPDQADVFPRDPDEWEDVDGDWVGDNLDRDAVDVGPLRDASLRAVAAQALGKAADASVSADELEELSELSNSGLWYRYPKIRDLRGLEHAVNLTELTLSETYVSDLAPLSRLRHLQSLRLNGGEVSDLSQLSELRGLTYLNVSRNNIGDLAGLQSLTGLRGLVLSNNLISDLSALTGLESLERLDVGSNQISNPSPLSALTQLQRLDLGDNHVSDLTGLEGLVNLTNLTLSKNAVADLSALTGLGRLEGLLLEHNQVSDLPSLSELTELRVLRLDYNQIGDLSGLEHAVGLRHLSLGGNQVTDLAPLSGLGNLETLSLRNNRVSNLSPLSLFSKLRGLDLGHNEVTDLSPLADVGKLQNLDVAYNPIRSLSSLSGLSRLRELELSGTAVALTQILELPYASQLVSLGAAGLGYRDLTGVSVMTSLESLNLQGNAVTDVEPLAGLTGVEHLDLSYNAISEIGALVNQTLWESGSGAIRGQLSLSQNPLSESAKLEHIPMLSSWGLQVSFEEPFIVDPVLRATVAQHVAFGVVYVDTPITTSTLLRSLAELSAFGAGIQALDGLEYAEDLSMLYLGKNDVADLRPLENLPDLQGVDLSGNRVVDIGPLARNLSLGEGDWLTLTGNPLSEISLNTHVPALLERGAHVTVDSVRLILSADEAKVDYDVSGYFAALLGEEIRTRVEVGKSQLATVEVRAGVLQVERLGPGGMMDVVITATDQEGQSARLVVNLDMASLPFQRSLSFLPQAADTARQGFTRIINRSGSGGEVWIQAIDDTGASRSPISLALGAGRGMHFNSRDLEHGNPNKGLSGGVGSGTGDWRLSLEADLDLQALTYVRTPDGFLTSMHDVAPGSWDSGYRVAFFNPGSNNRQVSWLRLANPNAEEVEAVVTGVDDLGMAPSQAVTVILAPGAAQSLSAQALESGEGLDGALGDGNGKWRLRVEAERPILVSSLLESPGGHLSNLSTVPENRTEREGGGAVHTVPLFPSAANPLGREGFVRVVNRGASEAIVTIKAHDDTDWDYDPVTLAVDAGHVVGFNSSDLELGNVGKGLAGSTGPGTGDWWLELTGDADVEVLSYIRTPGGFVTSMHDTVPATDGVHRVPTFNPASNTSRVSVLRLVNPGPTDARVLIEGTDDDGLAGASPVELTVPANKARTLSAQLLESGGPSVTGSLGDGAVKWRLAVRSDPSILVMSLLDSVSGHLSNLSTAPE